MASRGVLTPQPHRTAACSPRRPEWARVLLPFPINMGPATAEFHVTVSCCPLPSSPDETSGLKEAPQAFCPAPAPSCHSSVPFSALSCCRNTSLRPMQILAMQHVPHPFPSSRLWLPTVAFGPPPSCQSVPLRAFSCFPTFPRFPSPPLPDPCTWKVLAEESHRCVTPISNSPL
eukprot:EG_transcript_15865